MRSNSPLRFLFFPFIVVLVIVSLYFVYQNNPYLMAQEALFDQLRLQRGQDITLLNHPRGELKLTPEDLKVERALHQNLQRDRRYPENLRPTHRWATYANVVLNNAKIPKDDDDLSTAVDSKGAYVLTPDQLLVYKLNGELIWDFAPPAGDTFIAGPISTTSRAILVASTGGRLYAFEKRTGQILWYAKTNEKFTRAPFFGAKFAYVFAEEKPDQTWALFAFQRETGEFSHKIGRLAHPLLDEPAFNADESTAFFTTPKAIYAIDLNEKKPLWKVENEADREFAGGPSVSGDRVYAITTNGIASGYEARGGRPLWTTDLDASFTGGLSLLPEAFKVYIRDRSGYIHALNSRTGKREWRFNTGQTGPIYDLYFMRMRGSSFADLKVQSVLRYWTLWTFCGGTRLCIFDPKEGQPYMRTELKGKPLSDPHFEAEGEDMWVVHSEGGQLRLGHYMEDKKLKSIRDSESKNSSEP